METSKTNCWEFKNCGRQPGGAKVGQLGVCPASIETRVNGMHGGRNGGRVCWAVTGTFCGGVVQGTFAAKLTNCIKCEFYTQVVRDEGRAALGPREVLERLQA
jgi:hypothetical protein